MEHRKRVLSPYFLNKQGRKDYDDVSGDFLCQHGTFEENLKVEENSCRIMKVSKYSQKDEQESKMEHRKRVVSPCFKNWSTKSFEEFLSQFKYHSE